ncbi:MAG: hypothetical protein LC715_02345 [Gammaproteobacteria bacterium]|nr:hypothetical protein [Gammaproteobacteria bacterium]
MLVLSLCFAAQADASKKVDDAKQGSFNAPVTIAADGRAEIGQIEGVSGVRRVKTRPTSCA